MKLTPVQPLPNSPALPCYLSKVSAGFPSPADDYIEQPIDIYGYLIKHPTATYFARAEGESMTGVGIYNGDLLIVDRALNPQQGSVVIAAIDGELTCKILDKTNRCLNPANTDYPSIPILESMDMVIEGVVSYSVRMHVHSG